MSCPFCAIQPEEIIWESSLLVAIRDRFPLNPGHTLIIPRRHVSDWFGATGEERQQLLVAVDDVRALLERERRADGYNVGFNAGLAAGQTVPHAHLHVIPRFVDDVPDPRGGIRHVVPQRARYWETKA